MKSRVNYKTQKEKYILKKIQSNPELIPDVVENQNNFYRVRKWR